MSFAALKGHPRLTPVRGDLAAIELKGEVHAPRYVEGRELSVSVPLLGMIDGMESKDRMINQIIFGERFTVYEMTSEWAWGQSEDGYVGYVPAKSLRTGAPAPTHRVVVQMAHLRATPDAKAGPGGGLPYGARVQVIGEADGYLRMEGGGYVPARQLAPISDPAPDWVAEAETFVRSPYLWGGRNHSGVDCSGLIQISMQAAGLECPRDSDMQEAALGDAVPADAPFSRGDLVFWKGHVGVMTDPETLFHANAHHMITVYEPLEDAKTRIAAAGGGEPTATKRLG